MTTVGLMRCKDEQDIIETTIRHLATQVDEILVADNLSTDDTPQILARLATELPLAVVEDRVFANYGSRVITGLAREAYRRGHRWAVACDADELWFGPMRIGTMLAAMNRVNAVTAVLYNHVPTTHDPDDPNPVRRMGWREREPQSAQWARFAFRLRHNIVVEQGNHAVTPSPRNIMFGLTIHHFPYRSLEQFIRKAGNGKAVYDAANLDDGYGHVWKHHGSIAEQGEQALVHYWNTNILRTLPDPALVLDPCP